MTRCRLFVLTVFICFTVIYIIISYFYLKSAAIPANLNTKPQKQIEVITKRKSQRDDVGDVKKMTLSHIDVGDDTNSKRKSARVYVHDDTKRKSTYVDDVNKRTSPTVDSHNATKRKQMQPLTLSRIDVDEVMTSLLRRKPCFGQFWRRLVKSQAKHGAKQFTLGKNGKTRSSYKAYTYSGTDETILNMLVMIANAEAETSCGNVSKANSMCSDKCAGGDFDSVSVRFACEKCKLCSSCLVQRQTCEKCVLTKCNNCTKRDNTRMGRYMCDNCVQDMCNNCLKKANDVEQPQKCIENNCANETPPSTDVSKPCWSNNNTSKSRSRDTHHSRCNCVVMQKPQGRTGNQMFELAATISLAYHHDAIPVLHSAENPLNKLFAFAPDTSACVPAKDIHHFHADVPCVYYKDVEALNRNLNWTLDGFLQSWKYFGGRVLEVVIRKLFTPIQEITTAAERFIANVSRRGVPNVCLHMRRGDFVSKHLQDIGYVTGNMTFVNKSIEYFKNRYKRVQIIVLSDSIDWCKANIFHHHSDVIFSPFRLAGDDMVLMMLCDHVIVTSGSFGWWGGWFSRGETAYFSGYPRTGSWLDKQFRHGDYYPPTWVPL